MKKCNKKKHYSEDLALSWQHLNDNGYYRAYECKKCHFWHITTGFNSKHHIKILKIIQENKKNSNKKVIEKVSGQKTIFEINLGKITYQVLYHKRQRKVQILNSWIS